MNEVHCKVFVGFGGSGCKTLRELARMFAADKELAGRCESEAYFLLVDTDQGDLESYTQEIESEFAAVGEHPFVKSMPLAQGVTRMDSAILSAMKVAKKSDKGLQRMRQVWWFDDKDKPFIARNLQTPPSQGAAQCPAISYFLSWKAMQGTDSLIGSAVAELCEEMRRRVAEHHSAQYSTRVSLHLVAGLAGGTGRGSWAPLSLRIQQELRAQGYHAFANGVFFDQTCYADIQQNGQGQRVKMIVNSLTGISELAGWIDNDLNRSTRSGKRFFMRLPSFASPQSPAQDTVNSFKLLSAGDDTGEGGTGGATPVSKAYIVFAQGRAGRLEPGAHYKLAASALYGASSESIIASEESNERIYLGSLGASCFRVNVHEVRNYLTDRVEFDCIRALADRGTVSKKKAGPGVSVEAAEVVDALLLPLLVDSSDKGLALVPEGAPSSEPRLLVRLQAELLGAAKGSISGFLDELEEMDPEEYESKLNALLKRGARGEKFTSLLGAAIRGAIQHVFGAGLVGDDLANGDAGLIESYLRRALTRELDDPSASFAASGDAPARLTQHVASFAISQQVIDHLENRLGEVVALAEEVARGGETVSAVCAKLRKYRRKKFLVAGARFDEDERVEVKKLLQDLVLTAGRESLPAALEKWLKSLRSQLGAWKQNLDFAVQASEHRAGDLERTKLSEDQAQAVFTTPKELRELRRDPAPARSYFRPDRYLEPYATDADFEQWGRDLLGSSDARLKEALAEIQSTVLIQAMTGRRSKQDQRAAERELYRKLEEFRSNIVITRDWLADRFGMLEVANRLVNAFADEIEACKASPKQVGCLHDHFLRQFGFHLETRRGRLEVPSPTEIITKMATDLGENCGAQYLVDGNAGGRETKTAHVFLPTDEKLAGSKQQAEKLVKGCNKEAKGRGSRVQYHVDPARVDADEEAEARGNPFLMLAMVTEGFLLAEDGSGPTETSAAHAAFEQVSSLRYHSSDGDPHVKTYLDWAERPDGKSIFADVNYSFGLGYILPAFVTDKGLRDSRWRPWAKEMDQQFERQANAGVDAMLYAMLGNAGKAGSPIYSQRVARDDGSKVAWTLPLIKFGGAATKNGFSFTRRAFNDDYGYWDATAGAFEGDETASSIAKLVSQFEAEPGIQQAIAREAAHFFGEVCTEEGIIERVVRAQFRSLREWLNGTLRKRLEKLPNFQVDYSDHLAKLEERALALSKMTREELAELYRGA